MNIRNYIEYSKMKYKYSTYVCDDYVDIFEEYANIAHEYAMVTIDIPTYIHGTVTINTYHSVTINNIISTKGSLNTEFQKLVPGSYVGKTIYDTTNPYIHYVFVNGYVTKSGIIS